MRSTRRPRGPGSRRRPLGSPTHRSRGTPSRMPRVSTRKVTSVVSWRRTSASAPSRQSTGHDGVRPPREFAEHPACVVSVHGLAVDAPIEEDGRVDAEREAALLVNGARLPLGVPAHELDGVVVRRVVLDVVRWGPPRTGSRAARGSSGAAGSWRRGRADDSSAKVAAQLRRIATADRVGVLRQPGLEPLVAVRFLV